MRNDTKPKPGTLSDNYSYVETPHEAAARYLDRAINEISTALALDCMKEEPQTRMELFKIGEMLCQKRIQIGGIPDKNEIRFGKLEAK